MELDELGQDELDLKQGASPEVEETETTPENPKVQNDNSDECFKEYIEIELPSYRIKTGSCTSSFLDVANMSLQLLAEAIKINPQTNGNKSYIA